MKKYFIIDYVVAGTAIFIAVVAFNTPNSMLKVSQFLSSVSLFIMLMRGRVSDRILNPIIFIVLFAFLYVYYKLN